MEDTKSDGIASTSSNDLYKKILDENVKLHAIEAPYYEKLHPEEFNWFEQGQIFRHLKFIKERLGRDLVALDIGCGTGNISLKLLGMGFEVSGVDISEEMLSVLRNRVSTSLRGRIKLSCKNIDSFLADCPEQFDLITVSSVLHHVPGYVASFKRAVRLLKPGGFIYIVHEPTRGVFASDRFLRKILWQVDNLAYSILNFYRIPRVKDRSYKISDYNLYHGFEEEKIVSACRDEGLDILEFKRYASCMRLGISCWVDSILLKSESQFFLIAKRISKEGSLSDKRLIEFYNYDRQFGAVFNDINESQYGVKDGVVSDPSRYHFFYEVLLKLIGREIAADSVVLDMGCGAGILAEAVHDKVKKYIGIDISDERIKQAKARNKYDNCLFEEQDAQHLTFPDASFDAAVAIEVIEHVPDIDSFLSETNRVLVKGGTFVLTTPASLFFKNKMECLYKDQHIYEFSIARLKSILKRSGFSVRYVTGIGFKIPRIIIPVWLGSDIIKYIYERVRNVRLNAGYGKPISLEFGIVSNPIINRMCFSERWKNLAVTLMKIFGFIGNHCPVFSNNIVMVCQKKN